jgi:VWFA-related protein
MRWLKAVFGSALIAAAVAQQPKQPKPEQEDLPPSISVDVNVVSLLYSVRDKRGALISNLSKDDFTFLEDNKQQQIKTFTRETDLPMTIGLLVDVSKSQENLIDIERQAASQFFREVLRPKDMAFLISFGAEAELLQDYTNSARLLQDGLRQLRLNAPTGGLQPGPVPTAGKIRGTILYDAVYLGATEKLKGEVGRKVIVIISDGGDQGSRETRGQAIEAAHKADAIIYSIYYVDPMFGRQYGYSGDEGALRKMSEETGGRVFQVDKKHSLHDIFAQIQEEMRSQYSATYTPTNSARDGSFRKIEIRPSNKELKVQARKGYYAVK